MPWLPRSRKPSPCERSSTSCPRTTSGLAFGFGGGATLSRAAGMIHARVGSFGSATFSQRGRARLQRIELAQPREIDLPEAGRIRAGVAHRAQPLPLIGGEALNRALQRRARRLVVAREMLVQGGDFGVGADRLLDTALRLVARKGRSQRRDAPEERDGGPRAGSCRDEIL